MPKTKAELMAALRLKRHKLGLELFSFWIKKADKPKVEKAIQKYRQDKPKS